MRARLTPVFVAIAVTSLCVVAGSDTAAQDTAAQDTVAPTATPCTSATSVVPMMLTPITSAMPQTAGALVAGFRIDPSGGATLSFDGVRLLRGRRINVPLQAVTLAPGLVRLTPTSRVRAGLYRLEGLGTPTDLTVSRLPMPGPPVRPAVTEARRVAASSHSGLSVELRATLGFAVPSGIVAVVSYWNTDTTPSAWSPAVIGQTELVLWGAAPHACGGISGLVAPPQEGTMTVRIAYVDQFGQVSPASEPVTVP